ASTSTPSWRARPDGRSSSAAPTITRSSSALTSRRRRRATWCRTAPPGVSRRERVTAPTSRPAAVTWSKVKLRFAELSPAELLRVLQELYDRSADNRRYLAAKFLEGDQSHILDEYRERILALFSFEDARRTPRLGTGRKAIRDYWRATGDHEGTAELMLTYV